MRLWPFGNTERRDANYTDELVTLLVRQATGEAVRAKTGAVESCVGMWGRAFAVGQVLPADTPAAAALDAWTLNSLGRSLCSRGEWVAEVMIDPDGNLYLDVADTWTVQGDGPPWTWLYELTFNRPSIQATRTLPAARVVHVRLPGGGPLAGSKTTCDLLGAIDAKLALESGGPVGYLLPVPAGRKSELAEDLRGLKGEIAVVETTTGGWDAGKDAAPKDDYVTRRIGAAPPAQLQAFRESSERSIYAATGVPILTSQQDGTAQREQLRRFLHSTITPIAEVASVELRAKLNTPALALDFSRLYAADLSGRARAYASLVAAGLPADEAKSFAGLLTDGGGDGDA